MAPLKKIIKNTNATQNAVLAPYHFNKESARLKRGDQFVLDLFHSMAERVPAYKDFLSKNGIVNHQAIRTIQDFKQVPLIDKNNYLRAYPRKMLCWDGQFKEQSWVISSTSGSTGEPYYFPRQLEQDKIYADTAERYLLENFQIDQKSTLYVVAFPMGSWIGGVFTYQAVEMIARTRGYALSVITPGIDKKAIIDAVKSLGHEFDQVVIGSYAPFLKDILDDGEAAGLRWRDYRLGFIFSAEVFSEKFRDYVINKAGLDNPYTTTLNHYGTVDLGTMAHETPFTIWLRRYALGMPELYRSLFHEQHKLPTVAQYIPDQFYFETIEDDHLICSSSAGLPLVRYDLKDRGGVLTLKEVRQEFSRQGLDLNMLLPTDNVANHLWDLPIVYVFERRDFSVSFFAFQIYPETIRNALQAKEFDGLITGKFTMSVQYDKSGRQKLIINVESKFSDLPNDMGVLKRQIKNSIVNQLLLESSEFRATRKELGQATDPVIVFWPYEDATFFKAGVKQRWALRNV